jgi:hypothetical protein
MVQNADGAKCPWSKMLMMQNADGKMLMVQNADGSKY